MWRLIQRSIQNRFFPLANEKMLFYLNLSFKTKIQEQSSYSLRLLRTQKTLSKIIEIQIWIKFTKAFRLVYFIFIAKTRILIVRNNHETAVYVFSSFSLIKSTQFIFVERTSTNKAKDLTFKIHKPISVKFISKTRKK